MRTAGAKGDEDLLPAEGVVLVAGAPVDLPILLGALSPLGLVVLMFPLCVLWNLQGLSVRQWAPANPKSLT